MSASTMTAVVLTGHGDYDRLEYRTDVPVPQPGSDQALIRVTACGLNNTDINTRIGWYGATADDEGDDDDGGGGWSGSLSFPRIQGADVCGTVVSVGSGVDSGAAAGLIGRRVLLDPWWLDADDPLNLGAARYFGSEVDGGFAQYCVAPVVNVHPVDSPLSDAELATFACSSQTAENLLTKARVTNGDVVVITGASGGVGTAAVQLAKARGAHVVAVASVGKASGLLALGADAVVDRAADDVGAAAVSVAPSGRIDAVADVVGGAQFEQLLPVIRPGGSYATSGAIADPMTRFDLRWLIYGDLNMAGATVCPPGTFARVVTAVEAGTLRPVLAATYPLADLVKAQKAFLTKAHIGNIVVTMP